MTEKRYYYDYEDCDGHMFVDTKTGRRYPLKTVEDYLKIKDLLNDLINENKQLKQQLENIENRFEFSFTENCVEFNKDKLHVKDTHAEIKMENERLIIVVYPSQTKVPYCFNYMVVGRSLREQYREIKFKSNGE